MARKSYRPGRTLVVFFLVVAVSYGLVALGGTWKPELGLDLKGGTRIMMTATGNPTSANLNEAAGIIDQRVNGSGVAEAEVTTQGGRNIIVEIPGPTSNSLVGLATRTAQLRFRTVACTSQTPGPCATGAAPTLPNDGPSLAPTDGATGNSKNRPGFLAKPSAKPSQQPSQTASASESSSPTESPSESSSESPGAGSDDPAQMALDFMTDPGRAAIEAFNAYTCPTTKPVDDNPDKFLVTCGTEAEGDAGVKYLLSPAAVEGTDLNSADAVVPSQSVSWIVQLSLGGEGKGVFADLSRAMSGTGQQFAVVLDGVVISSPVFTGVIPNGDAQITGNFTKSSAQSLATSLKYGALPIAFDKEATSVEQIGASLAGDQLSAGILAGIIGLALVMLYCLLYYRGLGLVVIASLVVAGVVTYSTVLLLSRTAGFTLTLPGIAGLIVAVGITADSFIVYFERIRDEMRDGKSMRVAVQAGWKRARGTCVAADTVSLLAAIVLYIFATGVVKGFAFTLGISTVIDLAIFFWFTHPMVSVLGKYKFFNRGHKLSGLDAEALGVDRINIAGGRA
ncbi:MULTISPECIES: protein translocase subunit SecD [unclassified Nocardioides]|uniref:protein translocase subunit SecD n=1 Tax=unclassified Nocardioides TaxID=2615069 RepID=UPI000056F9F1|nr:MULTISPECIES: protein translocase subunit SecD [unclassified Nocardioides]ABL81894.1 protein-export membrane protein SecD [Nocardioides sp. JS614]